MLALQTRAFRIAQGCLGRINKIEPKDKIFFATLGAKAIAVIVLVFYIFAGRQLLPFLGLRSHAIRREETCHNCYKNNE